VAGVAAAGRRPAHFLPEALPFLPARGSLLARSANSIFPGHLPSSLRFHTGVLSLKPRTLHFNFVDDVTGRRSLFAAEYRLELSDRRLFVHSFEQISSILLGEAIRYDTAMATIRPLLISWSLTCLGQNCSRSQNRAHDLDRVAAYSCRSLGAISQRDRPMPD